MESMLLMHKVDLRLQCHVSAKYMYTTTVYTTAITLSRPILEEDDDNISSDSMDEDDLENDGANFDDNQL